MGYLMADDVPKQKTDAELIDEWLAAGNEITRERDEEYVVSTAGGYEWCYDSSAWAEFRCKQTGTFGRRLPSNNRLRIVAYICVEPRCGQHATVAAEGSFWCDEHGASDDC